MSAQASSGLNSRYSIFAWSKYAGVQIILIYLVVFALTLLALTPFSRKNAEVLSEQALAKIERHFDDTIGELSYLIDDEYQN